MAAAVTVQRQHQDEAWPGGVTVRIRLGLHTGEPAVGDDGYTGLDVVRASRIAAVGRGGQVLLSDTTRAIVANDLPDGVSLRSLGDQRLKDIDQPEPLHELHINDVPVSAEPEPLSPRPDAGLPAEALASMPGWVRDVATQLTPVAGRASQLIEERVLAEIEASFRERDAPAPDPRSARTSVADEIAKLKALRDEGALTDEQYSKALDRTIAGAD